MRLKYYLRKLLSMSLYEIIYKVNKRIVNSVSDRVNRFRDLHFDSHIKINTPDIKYKYIDIEKLDTSKIDINIARYLCDMYLGHRFDVLGSGWINVNYDIDAPGLEGYRYDMSPHIVDFDRCGRWLSSILLKPYSALAAELWGYIKDSYQPIDWQMDFKSGYRFSQKKWYKDQRSGVKSGVDIKVPWEISRMQHLPQLAVFSILLPDLRLRLIEEFKYELIDFIMANPPRMGVNWSCTMDVGIRAANILLAYDIFRQMDDVHIIDDRFHELVSKSIYEHSIFIINNLEWNEGNTSNHYLSNISGLLFISAYLKRSEEMDAWLVFSVQEIIESMKRQFHDDGTNFEASSSYHRLSGELVVYDTALIYGVLKTEKIEAFKSYNKKLVKRLLEANKQKCSLETKEFFPGWYIERLYSAACFTVDITKPSKEVPQIGDNDSGRFFKLSPCGDFLSMEDAYIKYENLSPYLKITSGLQNFWEENILNHGTFVSAADGLFDNEYLSSGAEDYPLEKSLIQCLSGGVKHSLRYVEHKAEINRLNPCGMDYIETTEINIRKNEGCLYQFKSICYPHFGAYIYKGKGFYLLIRGGVNSKSCSLDHAHNDKLSFELNIDGQDIFIDPGTYIYTPILWRRNEFRSDRAHNIAIIEDREQNEFLGTFTVKDESECYLLDYRDDYIKLYLAYRDVHYVREYKILNDKIIISDSCNKKFKVNFNRGELYSNGYGRLVKR